MKNFFRLANARHKRGRERTKKRQGKEGGKGNRNENGRERKDSPPPLSNAKLRPWKGTARRERSGSFLFTTRALPSAHQLDFNG
jgi:hypothetical protein